MLADVRSPAGEAASATALAAGTSQNAAASLPAVSAAVAPPALHEEKQQRQQKHQLKKTPPPDEATVVLAAETPPRALSPLPSSAPIQSTPRAATSSSTVSDDAAASMAVPAGDAAQTSGDGVKKDIAGAGRAKGALGNKLDAKSRFQFPVEMLVDSRKGGNATDAPADTVSDWEELIAGIEGDMKITLERSPNNVSCIMDYSSFLRLVLEDENWVSRTEDLFKTAMKADPKHAETQFRYAHFVQEYKGDYQEATDLYHRVLQNEPKHVLALANLATIQHSINENEDEAEELYEQALSFRPERPGYFTVAYHTALNDSRDYPLPCTTDYAGVLYNFGAFQHEFKRNLTIARGLYELSLEYDPNSTSSLNNFATLLAVQKDYEVADAIYKRAAMLEPYDAITWHNYGVLAIERGLLDKAFEYFNKVLKIDPFYMPTCLTYGRLLLETKCDHEGAERMYKRVLRRNPGQVHALVGYAQVAQVRGDSEVAEEMYSRATDFHERNVAALIHKALYYELSRKDIAAADELYGKAQKLDGGKAKELHERLLPR